MNHPTWKPATIPARDPVDPKELPPIPYVMTNRDRDDTHIVRLDIIAQTRREKLTDFVPGLVVTDLSPEDLTTEQRVALGLEGA